LKGMGREGRSFRGASAPDRVTSLASPTSNFSKLDHRDLLLTHDPDS
jgi:hypothetical protein